MLKLRRVGEMKGFIPKKPMSEEKSSQLSKNEIEDYQYSKVVCWLRIFYCEKCPGVSERLTCATLFSLGMKRLICYNLSMCRFKSAKLVLNTNLQRKKVDLEKGLFIGSFERSRPLLGLQLQHVVTRQKRPQCTLLILD